jgi:phospholipid/cholesterol/gamma-HCH transport system substrate-binding protein
MKRSTFITWDQLKVGLLILVALGVMTLAVFKLGQAANLFSERYELVAFLQNANGLREGGQVTVAGQIAGAIEKIEFLPVDADTTRNLRVTVKVDERLRPQVRGDSRARLRTMGLLGDKIFDISPGTPRYAALEPGDTVPMGESLDLEQVIQRASGAVDDMVGLTRDLREITGGIVRGEGTVGQLLTNRKLYDELTLTLGRTNQMISSLQNRNGTIGRLIEDPALYNNAVSAIASVNQLVQAAQKENGTLGRLLTDTTLYTSIVGIAQSGDSLVSMIANGQGTAGKLITDQQLYDQLLKSVTDLNAILEDVRKNPSRYLRGVVKVF